MQHAKLLRNILGKEKCGRVARRLQMLIVLFVDGGTFAAVGLSTKWDRRTVALWYGRFSECKKSLSGIREALSDRQRWFRFKRG